MNFLSLRESGGYVHLPDRSVTRCNTQIEKRQSTLSTWECKKLIDKINFLDPLLEWTNGHCGCVKLVDYIPFDYLHVAFGVWIKKL